MSLTHDNKYVFSAGNDGSLCCFHYHDKELKKERERAMIPINEVRPFEEIMIQTETKANLTKDIARLERDIYNVKANNEASLAEKQAKNDADHVNLKSRSAYQKEDFARNKHQLEDETQQVER